MIMDKLCEFADATAVNTGVAATYVIGSTIDANIARDLGQGQPLYLIISVATAIASATGTFAFELRSHTATPIIATSKLHLSTGAKLAAAWPAGLILCYALPMGEEYNRYLGITQVTGVAAATAGAINAFLTLDPHGWRAYPEGLN